MDGAIRDAATPGDVARARSLFEEYAAWLNVDLCFQGFAEELATLPGAYARPAGCLLVSFSDSELSGCGAMRPLRGGDCEMKRLYVRPPFRGHGIGRWLATEVIAIARRAEYGRMYLDTLESMTEARALYRSLGFSETAAYYNNPEPGAVYMVLPL